MNAHELIEMCARICSDAESELWRVYKGTAGAENLKGKGSEYVQGAADESGLLAQAIRALKSTVPDGVVCEMEAVAWMESPYGEIRVNQAHKHTFPPQSLDWQIPLYRALKEKP
jgi:hypothetical protein